MMKLFKRIGSCFVSLILLWSCTQEASKQVLPEPEIIIRKIIVDGVEYEPTDTLVMSVATDVRIDYAVKASTNLFYINDYYVYGSSGSLITRHEKIEFASPREYSGQLVCNDFPPFRCGFRILAVDSYGGATSKGFYLRLPANGLRDINGTTATLAARGEKKFGPNQRAGYYLSIWNDQANGRYDERDMANAPARAQRNDFGIYFKDSGGVTKTPILFSTTEMTTLFPISITYGGGATVADLSETKFVKLGRFTSSMWADLTYGERVKYLADGSNPTQTVLSIEPNQYYLFKTTCNNPSYNVNRFGVIFVKSVTTTSGKEEVAIETKMYKYY